MRVPGPRRPADRDESGFVRLYLMTGGRTRPDHMLGVDTVLEAGPGRLAPGQPQECGQILTLCRARPRSVAEIAGTIQRNLTLTRVLLGDLVNAQALVVPRGTVGDDAQFLAAVGASMRRMWPDAESFMRAG
ncbi:DUF742 domain-containing protein [Streptomyces sp. NPDC005423]|uniref:DUF742 domain-containing protein n=1 Tax=Streptomyces sp. NPDC005423 TaxID=3155343 RepID=UPI0033AD15BD